MTESNNFANQNLFELCSTIKGYYINENPKAVFIKIHNGSSFWVPKHFIESSVSKKEDIIQEFTIENFILRKIGINFDKI